MRTNPSSAGSVPDRREDPAAIPLEYVPIPAGPNGSTLIAHDRHRLVQVVARALIPARTLRVGSLPHDSDAVPRVEAKAVKRLRRLRRHARARQWAQLVASLGLPFLVASLMGLVSVPIGYVPAIGEAVANFIGSSGGSLGGLPLAAVISLLPSVWLFRRARRQVAARPAARGTEKTLQVADLAVREDASQFLTAADALLAEIGSLMSGRSRIDGQRALRLATRFDRLTRLAAHYRVSAVQAFAADMAAQFRHAGRPPRRLIPGLYAKRNSAHVSTMVSPYDPATMSRAPTLVTVPAIFLVGALAAITSFLAAGVFRLSADDALVLLQNEAVVFPSSAGVFSLGQGFDQPSDSGAGTLSVVEGPGLFWSWPQPVTERRLINLTDREAPVTLILPTEAEPEDLIVQFQYDVTDLTAFVRLGVPEFADQFIAVILQEGLTQLLGSWRESLVAEFEGNSARVNEELQSGMGQFLGDFVDIANQNERLTGLGIILKPQPNFNIQRT